VSLRLTDLLYEMEKAGFGEMFEAPTDVELEEHEIVVPDLVFVLAHRRHILGRQKIEGVPDLIIEILSPSTSRMDEGEKRALYARVGVPEYWLVDPERETVRAFALGDGAYAPIPANGGVTRSRVLPDFAVDAAALFAGLS
jgi:Uma2 family endonuclease